MAKLEAKPRGKSSQKTRYKWINCDLFSVSSLFCLDLFHFRYSPLLVQMSKVCIQCGREVGNNVTKLYHQKLFKKTRILKLVQCEYCDKICDKYLEYEETLLLLDVALQNRSALRHILINENHCSSILKVSLLTLIIDSYCR